MIHIEKLHKTFRQFEALKNINLHIKPGSIFGLVGPNGAGKTTLIKTMLGILMPTSGQIVIDGQNVHKNPVIKSRIGYVSEYQSYYTNFSVQDMVTFYRKTYVNWNEERFAKLNHIFELKQNKKIRNLSKGMLTQLAVLLNLSFLPSVLVLDEPTSGLDPIIRRHLLNILMDEVAENGTTIFISTHNLNELERICDHIGMIHQGQILTNESLEVIKKNVRKIQVAFNAAELPEEFSKRQDVLKVDKQGRVYSIVVKQNVNEIMTELQKYQPLLLETVDMSLEDIFIYNLGGIGYGFDETTTQ